MQWSDRVHSLCILSSSQRQTFAMHTSKQWSRQGATIAEVVMDKLHILNSHEQSSYYLYQSSLAHAVMLHLT